MCSQLPPAPEVQAATDSPPFPQPRPKRPHPVVITVRLPAAVKADLDACAEFCGVSLNQLCLESLRAAVARIRPSIPRPEIPPAEHPIAVG